MTVHDAVAADTGPHDPGQHASGSRARPNLARNRAQTVGLEVSGAARRVWAWLVATYATIDPRSLGVCRILLGLLIFADVARRYRDLDAYYTNLGWLTNHFSLYKPMSSYVFSIYHAFSTPAEVRVLFFIHCVVNLMFLVGYRTRLTHLMALLLLSSLNARNIIIENGGFVMLVLLTMWSWFLPMGRRFSVDAWLVSWRSRRETTLVELNDHSRPRPFVSPVVSLAVTAIILQWAANYSLNTIQKDGPTWHNGTAIYYFAHQARLLHPFGVWLSDHMPFSVMALLTHGTLIVEGTIAFLWVSPFFPKVGRMVAWLLGIGLHLGILAFATLGPFVWVMMVPYAMFIPRELWEWGAHRVKRRRERLVMFLDTKQPVAITFARIVKRLDALEVVRFAPAKSRVARTGLLVATDRDPRPTKPTHFGKAALERVLRALPWPRWCAGAVIVSGCASVMHALVGRWLSEPEKNGRRFGLDHPAPRELAPASPARRRFNRIGRMLGEAMVVFLLVVSTGQVLMENRAVPAWMKPSSRPEWVTALVIYGRLFQGWSMFAPDPPREDGWVVVDGRTVDGRKLDPLTGEPPNFSLALKDGPNFSAQWEAFHMRIHEKRFSIYYEGFSDFLKNHHLLTGKPNDRLVSFDVWYVSRNIKPPGQGFTENSYRKLFGFGDVKDSGVPRAIPPKDKTVRASPPAKPTWPRHEQQASAPAASTMRPNGSRLPTPPRGASSGVTPIAEMPPARRPAQRLEGAPGSNPAAAPLRP